MSGVCAASDIWSVGCTVIELLTCVPPYFDLQPMPALFRIVQVGLGKILYFLFLSNSFCIGLLLYCIFIVAGQFLVNFPSLSSSNLM